MNSLEAFLHAIAQNKLQELSLNHRSIDDASLSTICAALKKSTASSNLKVIDLQGNIITDNGVAELCEALTENTSVSELVLFGNRFGSEGAKSILKLLEVNCTITAIHLESAEVGVEIHQEIEFQCQLNTQTLALKKAVPRLRAKDPSLTVLDLSNSSGKLSLTLLSKILSNTDTLETLILDNVGLGDSGADIIGKTIKDKKALKTLSLRNNGISVHGVKALIDSGLRANCSITNVVLSTNKLSDDAARMLNAMLLVNDTLTSIDVSDNAISKLIAEQVSYSLNLNCQPLELKRALHAAQANDEKLVEIDFAWIPGMGQCAHFIAPALKTNTYVQTVVMSNARVGDPGAFAMATVLRTNKSIRLLAMANNSITSEGACVLAQSLVANSTLTDLNVANNEIGDAGAREFVAALAANNSVIALNVELNNFSDELMEEIEGLCVVNQQPLALKRILPALESASDRLQVVDFSVNNNSRFLNDASCSVLCSALRENSVVHTVDLSNNCIGDLGAQRLASLLFTNCSIENLSLAENSIGDRGCIALANALVENTTVLKLNLKGNCAGEASAESFLVMLQQNHFVHDVMLEGNRVPRTLINELKVACAINLQPQTLKFLLPQLRKRDPALTEFRVAEGSGHRLYDDSAAAILCNELEGNEHIVVLELSNNKVADEGAAAIAALLTTPDCRIRELILANNPIGDIGVRSLASSLVANKTLTHLDLQETVMTSEGCTALAIALQQNNSVKSILVSADNVSQRAHSYLHRELIINNQPPLLKRILSEIRENSIACVIFKGSPEDGRLDDISARLLALELENNTSVTSLVLPSNEITSAGVEYLADMLEDNKTIREVILTDNRIDDAGARLFIKCLTSNCSVTVLELDGNTISKECLVELNYLLRVNCGPISLKQVMVLIAQDDPSIETLNFDGSSAERAFTDEAVHILCSLLVENQHVKQIDLSNNEVTDVGASLIADTLRVNDVIEEINLRGNKIGLDGARALFQALKANHVLITLNLDNNNIPPGDVVFEDIRGPLTVNAVPLKFPSKPRGEYAKRVPVAELDNKTLFTDSEYMQDCADQAWVDGMQNCPSTLVPRFFEVSPVRQQQK